MKGSGINTFRANSRFIQLIIPTAIQITKTASIRISTPKPKKSLTALKSFVARDMISPVFCLWYQARSKVNRWLNNRFNISNSIFRDGPNICILQPYRPTTRTRETKKRSKTYFKRRAEEGFSGKTSINSLINQGTVNVIESVMIKATIPKKSSLRYFDI